jgi:hypothetical protein
VSFAAIILCVASQRVFVIAAFVVVVYFVIDSFRKILDTPSYVIMKIQMSVSFSSNMEVFGSL